MKVVAWNLLESE
jgi:hypothetical protein